jgi:hypothetical protein
MREQDADASGQPEQAEDEQSRESGHREVIHEALEKQGHFFFPLAAIFRCRSL